MTARGAETPRGAYGFRQLIDLVEPYGLYPLDDELCDPVESFEPHALPRIEIDRDDLDLTTVPGIDGPGGVHHGDPVAGGES